MGSRVQALAAIGPQNRWTKFIQLRGHIEEALRSQEETLSGSPIKRKL